jgi:2-methylcitrate dehydratase PrpD
MQYCLAITLLDGQPGLAQFTDDRVNQRDVQDLLRRVQVRPDETLVEDLTRGHTPVCLSIRTSDGQQLQATRTIPPGSPEEPLSSFELEQKFLSNATPVLGPERAADALAVFNRFKQADSVQRVLDTVCGVENWS